MPTPSEADLRGLLAQAEQDLAEAEQRREDQARIAASLLDGTETRIHADKVSREINRTIVFIRANRDLLDLILN